MRYAHQQRAHAAVEMILAGRPSVVVDWGTGDGLVIERLLDSGRPPELVVAFEPGPMVELLRARLAEHPLGDRVRVCATLDELPDALAGRKVDVLACLGVLEHLPMSLRAWYYAAAEAHLAPDGCLLIDVPVEIGPAVVIKELARRYLKRRPPEYPTRELLARAIGRTAVSEARFRTPDDGQFIPSHAGFDHRHLIAEVEQHGYTVVERRNTPVAWAPSYAFNQEVLFRARRTAA